MNKGEFIERLSKELGTTKTEANKNLDILLKCISESLKDNDELKFVGFGTFKAKNSPEKTVKTPKGVLVKVPAQRGVRLSVGSEFKKTVNSK
jgi:DNA-binding protein HU-beta